MRPIGIYLHIPFCRVRCPYCSFNVYTRRTHLAAEYADSLAAELALRVGSLPTGSIVDTIYFGGGTPTLVDPGSLEALVDTVRSRLDVVDAPEVTVETEPGTTSPALFRSLRRFADRVTVGVQSFDDRALERIGRPHDGIAARAAVDQARAAGFDNIDLDLMFGLPGQSNKDWEADLAAALKLQPAHLSLYNLTIEPHTTFATALRKGRLELPSEDIQATMLRSALDLCGAAGLEHYETSNFARPGLRSRHNQAYWTGRPYLGLGAGAHGYLPDSGPWGRRGWNHRPPERWMAAVSAGELPEEGHEELSRAEAMLEQLFLGLRQRDGLRRDRFAQRFGLDPMGLLDRPARLLVESGLLTVDPNRLMLTEAGVILTDSVVSDLARALDTKRGSDNLDAC
jgi:oxygen-independent coproporphyrinogen III oxidase